MIPTSEIVASCAEHSGSRIDLWVRFVQLTEVAKMVEIGVYRGGFASQILMKCNSIDKYYMIDPWRHLDDWNKPANKSDDVFEGIFIEAKSKTEFASEKRIILRGKTTEVINEIADGEIDFAYVDGDHTLRGITTDLIRVFPKVRPGGWIGGDDFGKSIWQHSATFEPTLVFPFAVYFAEAVGAPIYALPGNQFLIEKTASRGFSFTDSTGKYRGTSLGNQFRTRNVLKAKIFETFPGASKIARRIRRAISGRVQE